MSSANLKHEVYCATVLPMTMVETVNDQQMFNRFMSLAQNVYLTEILQPFSLKMLKKHEIFQRTAIKNNFIIAFCCGAENLKDHFYSNTDETFFVHICSAIQSNLHRSFFFLHVGSKLFAIYLCCLGVIPWNLNFPWAISSNSKRGRRGETFF